jgi:hypothetical protein
MYLGRDVARRRDGQVQYGMELGRRAVAARHL